MTLYVATCGNCGALKPAEVNCPRCGSWRNVNVREARPPDTAPPIDDLPADPLADYLHKHER